MNFIFQRSGFFIKQGRTASSFKIYYFFVDNYCNMFYTTNFPLLEKIYKTCDSIAQISERLEKKLQKFYYIENCKVGPLKVFPSLDFIPFPNSNCFEMFLNKNSKQVSILIFGIPDDNIQGLYDFLKYLSSTKPPKKTIQAVGGPPMQRKDLKLYHQYSDHFESFDEYKEKFYILKKIDTQITKGELEIPNIIKTDCILFNPEYIDHLDIKPVEDNQVLQLENGSAYAGQVLEGLPHGVGTEFMKNGMSYKGDFRDGKWHGTGYIVNSNLDMIEAEFMDGELVGF